VVVSFFPLYPSFIRFTACISMGRHLFCVDAWISNGSGARATAVFDEYRRALCGIVSGLALHCNSISGSAMDWFSSIGRYLTVVAEFAAAFPAGRTRTAARTSSCRSRTSRRRRCCRCSYSSTTSVDAPSISSCKL
jgi:hypothetical protein